MKINPGGADNQIYNMSRNTESVGGLCVAIFPGTPRDNKRLISSMSRTQFRRLYINNRYMFLTWTTVLNNSVLKMILYVQRIINNQSDPGNIGN